MVQGLTLSLPCGSLYAVIRAAEYMARKPPNVGALAFKRSPDPSLGSYADAVLIKSFGEVPDNLDEL